MKKNSLFLLLIVLFIVPNLLTAQNMSSSEGKTFLGVGVGLPFGGYGARLSINAEEHLTVFGGAGYNMLGLAANGGVQLSIPCQNQAEVYFTGMFGYNSLIIMDRAPEYNKTYYGASVGIGAKIHSLRFEGSYWDVGVLAPFRPQSYKKDLQNIKKNPMMHIDSEPLPVLFYIGYNIMLSAKEGSKGTKN